MSTTPDLKQTPELTADAVQMAIRMRYNPIRGLTLQSLVTQLDNYYLGWLAYAAVTWETMQRRDHLLKAVIAKRSTAVSKLKLTVLQHEETPEAEAHAEALTDFYDSLVAVDAINENKRGGLPLLIRQMMDAQAKGFAVHELVWKPGEKLSAEFRFVPLWFFENRTGRLKFLKIPYSGAEGVEMEEGGWMVTAGEALMEASSILYCLKNMPLKDWVAYSDKFGTPGVMARTSAARGSDAGNAMREAARVFAQNFSAVIYGDDGAIKDPISLIKAEGGAGTLPFPPLVEYCERGMAVLWRGSDLSTMSADNKGASVQGEESEDLLADDAALISETLQQQVDRWVIWQIFGTAPLAYASLVVPERRDVKTDLEVDKFLLDAGAELGMRATLERYGRPLMEKGDTALHAPVAVTDRITDDVKGGKPPGTETLPNEATGKVADHLGVPQGWLSPIEKLLSDIQAKAEDSTVSDAQLLDFLAETQKSLPELFGEMDTDELAEVFESALGKSLLEGVRSGLSQAKKSQKS